MLGDHKEAQPYCLHDRREDQISDVNTSLCFLGTEYLYPEDMFRSRVISVNFTDSDAVGLRYDEMR